MTDLPPQTFTGDKDDTFNSDILANDGNDKILEKSWNEIKEDLPWSELRELFKACDATAAAFKKKTIRNGRVAVWFGFAAVAIVAAFPAFAQGVTALRAIVTYANFLAGFDWLEFQEKHAMRNLEDAKCCTLHLA